MARKPKQLFIARKRQACYNEENFPCLKKEAFMKQLTKSFSLILVLCFAWTLLLPITAFADTGPKPSVTVEFLEAPKGAYVTLLSKESSTGP